MLRKTFPHDTFDGKKIKRFHLLFGAALLLSAAAWIWSYRDVYLDPSLFLPRDNIKHHFPVFLYITRYRALLHAFPAWVYSNEGGIWPEVLANNFLILMPTHLLGYWLASVTHWPATFLYKLDILIGQAIFVGGLFWVSMKLFRSVAMALFLILIACLTSVTLTFLHQEHALGTLFYIPFFWLAFFHLPKSARSWVVFAALLGLSFNNHYPQLIMLYLAVIVIAASSSVAGREHLRACLKSLRSGGPWIGLAAVAAFLMSASPLIYSYTQFHDKLESPFRHQLSGITSRNYEDYYRLNMGGECILHPENLQLYFGFQDKPRSRITPLDDNLLFQSPAVPLVLLILLLFPVEFRLFHLVTITLFALLATGPHTPIPLLLWHILPGIELFRQWYFFAAFLDLHLLFATFFVLRWLWRRPFSRPLERGLAVVAMAILVAGTAIGWLDPMYGLVPALILGGLATIAGRWPKVRYQAVAVGSLGAWLFFGSLSGARFIMNSYRRYLVPYSVTHYGWLSGHNPLFELRSIYWEFVAVPKGIPTQAIKRLSVGGSFYWEEGDRLIRLAEADYRVAAVTQGFQVDLLRPPPRGAESLLFLQVDDGRWRVQSGGAEIASHAGPLGAVAIPIASLRSRNRRALLGLTVTRRPSLWPWCLILMGVPIAWLGLCELLLLSLPVLRRFSGLAIPQSLLANRS